MIRFDPVNWQIKTSYFFSTCFGNDFLQYSKFNQYYNYAIYDVTEYSAKRDIDKAMVEAPRTTNCSHNFLHHSP